MKDKTSIKYYTENGYTGESLDETRERMVRKRLKRLLRTKTDHGTIK